MSVNKPANLKPSNDDGENTKRGSLFERASGAFGLDRLKPAAVPDKLADDHPDNVANCNTHDVAHDLADDLALNNQDDNAHDLAN